MIRLGAVVIENPVDYLCLDCGYLTLWPAQGLPKSCRICFSKNIVTGAHETRELEARTLKVRKELQEKRASGATKPTSKE